MHAKGRKKLPNPENQAALPLMKTFDDALALVEKEKDSFYLDAYMFQGWLGQLVVDATAEYAEKKDGRTRLMQTGQTSRVFANLFGHATDQEFPVVFCHLSRFTTYGGDPVARTLAKALVPLVCEHACSGDYVGPGTRPATPPSKKLVLLLRRSVERWSEWVDAVVHLQIHQFRQLAPACFDPDPDKRELASLGTTQRHLGHVSDSEKVWWQWHHGEAAERFKDSRKWPTVGQAMAAEVHDLVNYAELDMLIISLWPLLKLHNWTYRDLMNVIGAIRPALLVYPCEREQHLASHCDTRLGLRKTGHGKTAKNGRPAGYDVAIRLCTP